MGKPEEGGMTRDEERFWSKVAIGDGCWEWTAGLDSYGYGKFKVARRTVIASRYSFLLAGGRARRKRGEICHRCDNRKCVRPSHLFYGTKRVNMQDASAKRRLAMGERHRCAKLDADRVVVVRRVPPTLLPIFARAWGVSLWTLQRARDGRTWAHVA